MHILKYLSLSLLITVFFISCEKDDSTVIDPILHFPHVDTAYVTPDTFDTSFVNCNAYAKLSSEEAIVSFTATVKDPLNAETIYILKNDGVLPDSAVDNWYTGTISFNMNCRLVGSYSVTFIAQNVSGLFSNTFSVNFNVINSHNVPPLISNLIIYPDSIRINSTGLFVFKVNAIDSNGVCDMIVYYDGKKPDNFPLTRRYLFDDGNCCIVEPPNFTSGDSIANDGIYTRKLSGAPDQLGYYRYYIKAVDRSGDSSNVLSDSIYVYP